MNDSQRPIVSVVIPAYHNYHLGRVFEAVIKSIKEQSVPTEIILSDQRTESNLEVERFCLQHNVKYVRSLPDVRNGKTLYNIGRVRNIGVAVSTGEFVYFNDGDILIHNKDFFRPLIEYSTKMSRVSLIRPKMRRISASTSDDFLSDYLSGKAIDFSEYIPICHVDYNNKESTIELVEEGEFRGLINNIPHASIRSNEQGPLDYDPSRTVEEHFSAWDVSIHHSATFCLFDTFCQVGGFCEEYYDWGMEDTDIQWKLNGIVGVQSIDDLILESSVMHFEHPKRYQDKTYKTNRLVFERRRDLGLENVRKLDTSSNNTFIGNFINGNLEGIGKFFDDESQIKFRKLEVQSNGY